MIERSMIQNTVKPQKLRQRISRKYGRYWKYYLFLIVPIAYVLLFNYYPMLGLQIAFKQFRISDTIWNAGWTGIYWFRRFLSSYQFMRILTNTVFLSLYNVFASFPFPILFALVMNCIENARFKKATQTISYLPHFISIVVLVSILQQVFNPISGLYGSVYKALYGGVGPDLFASTRAFPHLYVWSGVWQDFGYNSVIYFAALSNVDSQLHEAAMLDGANRFKRVIHVDIPTILPVITIMLILRTGSVMSLGFQKIYLMQNNLNISASEVISTYVYKTGLGSGVSNNYSYSTAIGMFNSVVNLFLVLLTNWLSRRFGGNGLW